MSKKIRLIGIQYYYDHRRQGMTICSQILQDQFMYVVYFWSLAPTKDAIRVTVKKIFMLRMSELTQRKVKNKESTSSEAIHVSNFEPEDKEQKVDSQNNLTLLEEILLLGLKDNAVLLNE